MLTWNEELLLLYICALYASIEIISILWHTHKDIFVDSVGHTCGIIYVLEFTYFHIYMHVSGARYFFFVSLEL